PAIADVHVEADGDHHTAPAVQYGAPVRFRAAALDTGSMHYIGSRDANAVFHTEEHIEWRIGIGKFHDLRIGIDLPDPVHEDGPFAFVMKVVGHQKSAAVEVLAKAQSLRVR